MTEPSRQSVVDLGEHGAFAVLGTRLDVGHRDAPRAAVVKDTLELAPDRPGGDHPGLPDAGACELVEHVADERQVRDRRGIARRRAYRRRLDGCSRGGVDDRVRHLIWHVRLSCCSTSVSLARISPPYPLFRGCGGLARKASTDVRPVRGSARGSALRARRTPRAFGRSGEGGTQPSWDSRTATPRSGAWSNHGPPGPRPDARSG